MTLALVIFAAITVIPGFGLLAALRVNLTWFERAVLGSVLGLSLLAIGGAFAAATQLELTRWIPSVLALAAWFWFRRSERQTEGRALPLVAALGVLLILPNILKILRNQPLTWKGQWSFYGDVPFQIAMVGGTGLRPAGDYPWAIDTPIHYTWLFHSALGAWAQLAHLTSAEMILHAWPIAYGLLLPLVVGILVYRVTKNYWTTLFTLLVLPFVRMGSTLFTDKINGMQFPISPTFEFGILLTATLVVIFLAVMPNAADRFAPKKHWYLLLITALAVFANTGSKGSTWFVTLGSIGILWLIVTLPKRAEKTTRFNTLATWLLGTTAVTGLVTNLLVVKTTAGTHVDPTHMFVGDTWVQSLLAVASILIVLATIAYSLWMSRPAENSRTSWQSPDISRRAVVAGAAIAGLISLIVLDHPDDSQNYFWYSAFVFFVVLAADVLMGALVRYRVGVILVVAVIKLAIFVHNYELDHLETGRGKLYALMLISLLGLAVLLAAYLLFKFVWPIILGRRAGTLTRALALAMVALIALIPIQNGLRSWSYQDREGYRNHEMVVSETQLHALQYIEKHSSPMDVVATNQYCAEAEATDPYCAIDAVVANPWFMTSAFTDRDVLFESNGYSWQLADAVAASKVVSANYRLSDSFMRAPTAELASDLKAKHVRFLYVNQLFAHAATYAPFAKLVWSKGTDQVWKLR